MFWEISFTFQPVQPVCFHFLILSAIWHFYLFSIINKQTSKYKTLGWAFTIIIFTKYNIHFRSQHIPVEITMKQLLLFHVSNSRKISSQLHISEPASNSHTSAYFDNLTPTAQKIFTASLSPSTRTSYHRTWTMLQDWSPSSVTLPISSAVLCSYIVCSQQLFA